MGLFDRRSNQTTAEVAASVGQSSGNPKGVQRSVTLVKGDSSAVDRATVDSAGSISLTKKFDKAGISLSKRSLTGIRAEAVLILDHSGSMTGDYRSGLVQTVVERALGFALQIDTDGKIPVIPFDSKVHKTVSVDLNNFSDIVDKKIYKPREMGGTVLAPALQKVIDMAKETDTMIFLIVVTDDSPNDREQVTELLKASAGYPLFVKVLCMVDSAYWEKLDDLKKGRLLDNLDAKKVTNIRELSDLEFADVMTDEYDVWIKDATDAGVLV